MRLGQWAVLLGVAGACAAQVQQLPPGTSSPLDQSRAAVPAAAGVQMAEARMAAQDWAGAAVLLKPLTQGERANGQALYDLGFCDESLGDAPGAVAAYTRAIEVGKTAVLPRVALGLLLARNGSSAEAEPLLSSAVALRDDGTPGAMAAQAQAYRALARIHVAAAPDRSRDELLLAIQRTSEQPDDVQLSGEIAEAVHDDASAEKAFARVYADRPQEADAAAQYARVLQREGKESDAARVLDDGLKEHPDSAELLSEKAGLLLHDKNTAGALPVLLRLHALHPGDDNTTRLLALGYVAQGDLPKADALFEEMSKADPTSGDVLAAWADSLIRQKRNAEAEALLERGLRGQFSTPEVRARAAEELAFAASVLHQPETVLRAVSIRNAILPVDATTAFLLATAHDSLQQSREAAGSYRQFLDLAQGKFPDEEWQAQQRLRVLSRAK